MLDWDREKCVEWAKEGQKVYEEKLHEYTITVQICKDHPDLFPMYSKKLDALKNEMDILFNMYIGVMHHAICNLE